LKTIAFSNYLIHKRSGTETFLLDVTSALSRRGHRCGIYTSRKGAMAGEFMRRGVPVWDRLDEITLRPDVLHCQHNLETIRLCHQFPQAPALFMVHGYVFWADETPRLPQIRCVATVSEYIRERVVRDTGLSVEQIPLIFNGADLNRFKPRPKLPERPKNLVLFCSNIMGRTHLDLAERVASRLGLKLEKIGPPFGKLIEAPEEVIGNFDLVLAVGRCAIEALCIGCAVIVIGSQGIGGLVTLENFSKFRRRNFGLSLLEHPLEEAILERAILSYNAEEAIEVGKLARERCDIERTVDDLLALYETLSERPGLHTLDGWIDPAFLVRSLEELCRDEYGCRLWAEDLDCACRRHEEKTQDLAGQLEEQRRACANHLAALETDRRRIMELESGSKIAEETIRSLMRKIHSLESDLSFRGFLSKKLRSLQR
jgi:Glycosyltransferase Family 4